MKRTRTLIIKELGRLRRFAYSLTGSKADADDLLQNVVVRLLENPIPNDVNPVPWMLRISKNIWIDETRHRAVRDRHFDSQSQDFEYEGVSSGASIQIKIDSERAVQQLTRLPEGQRLALSLVAIEGLSYAEVSSILDIPLGTVMSRVARARASMLRHKQENQE